MTTTADTESSIWVHDYTTDSGVQVAGHWRQRRSSAPAQGEDSTGPGLTGPGQPSSSPQCPSPPPQAPATTSAPPPAGSRPRSPAPTGAGASPPAPAARVAAAESRYQAALVSAGVSSLRHRRTDAPEVHAALRERQEAKAELEVARAELAAHDTPPAAKDPPAGTGQAGGASGSGTDRCPGCGQFRSDTHQCPTPAGLPNGDYAGLKGDDRVKAMVADLESSVKAIVESGQLHRWLDAMASNGLGRWSANNRILAAVQMLQRGESLEDLHMMGFRQWDKFNRKVSKGAKAVWILAPITRKIVDEDDDGNSTDHHRVVGFKGVPVFDVSDTQGDPLPASPTHPAPGAASPGTVAGLRDRVAQAGYTYEEIEIPGCRPATGEGALGYTDPQSKRIVVDARLTEAQKASTIAHELGHVHCGHLEGDFSEYQHHRGQMETEAEMTAYLVNRSRGMTRDQVDAFSPGYIAGWSKGDPTVMHQAVDKATRAFNKISEGPWPETKGN